MHLIKFKLYDFYENMFYEISMMGKSHWEFFLLENTFISQILAKIYSIVNPMPTQFRIKSAKRTYV